MATKSKKLCKMLVLNHYYFKENVSVNTIIIIFRLAMYKNKLALSFLLKKDKTEPLNP